MNGETERPFAELPAALVEEMLAQTKPLSQQMQSDFERLRAERHGYRNTLEKSGILRREGDLPAVPVPTTCGVDGAYALERLVATDLVIAAAVAVEGLAPPSETRFWPEPRHRSYVSTETHDEETGTLARAVMIGMELELASQAPHDVVFVDGSLTTPLIYFNQALSRAVRSPHLHLSDHLRIHALSCLKAYCTVLETRRTDKAWVAVPKYSVRREIGELLGWPKEMDDRAILTNLLQPGEFTHPRPLDPPSQPWHINIEIFSGQDRQQAEVLRDEIVRLLEDVHVVYARPRSWLPALRLEMNRAVAENPARLAAVIQALHFQCSAPGILEPYPLYLADRMVKHLGRTVPTLRQVTAQRLAESYSGDIGDIFLNLHGYRTESGR
ncbi:DNA double-strand break repair nuclease NurA [Candidatus Parcubacteria bacterium]|nr:MAG: DNA double-strand break repair nuclease NurA [Candidatus Parcubacteria bacterium]